MSFAAASSDAELSAAQVCLALHHHSCLSICAVFLLQLAQCPQSINHIFVLFLTRLLRVSALPARVPTRLV